MKLKRKLAMLTATATLFANIGIMQGNSQEVPGERTYLVYNFESDVITNEYTLTLPLQYPSTYYLPGIAGIDDREVYANSGIVYLSIDGAYRGTGFVVNDHTIATAAHCIYGKNQSTPGEGTFVSDLDVRLYDNNGNHVKTVSVAEAHVPTAYRDCNYLSERHMYDYALLTVSEDLSSYEHFKVGELLSSAATSGTFDVYAAGFPSKLMNDDGTTTSAMNELYIGAGKVTYDNGHLFAHTADTTGGQSGGPVFTSMSYTVGTDDPITFNTAIGIITGATGSSTGSNRSTKFTAEHLQFYRNNPYNTFEE